MNRSYSPGVLVLLAAGCGPLDRPMPARLDDNTQKEVNAAWDAALAPVGKYDRRRWLDALVGTQLYQFGVDTLSFRSEKAFAGGRVVMEVSFDRSKPADDRLTLTVLDPTGKPVRREVYSRAEVEQTARDLFDPARNQPAGQRAEAGERWKQIQDMLPKPREDQKGK